MSEQDQDPGQRDTTVIRPVEAAKPSETMDSRPRLDRDPAGRMPAGTRIGPFVLEDVLGAGGMGVIYAARDETLDRRVALKVLSDKLAADAAVVERFRREARSMAQLGSHPNIVQVHSAGREDELPHFVMELVEGQSIDQMLEKGPIAVSDAIEMLRQVTVALKVAHDRGILHRDIKPSNLMVTPSRTVKVLDFGLAKILQDRATDKKLTQGHEIMGSPHYMSPEQAKGRTLDRRSDIYSLGATFYHMLAGSPPFNDTSILAILHKHISEPLPPIESFRPDVPPPIRALLQRMMAKEPGDRPQDLDEVRLVLEGVMAPAAGTVGPAAAESGPLPWKDDKEELILFVKHGGRLPRWDFTPSLRFELLWLLGLGVVYGLLLTVHGRFDMPIIAGPVAFIPFLLLAAAAEWIVLRLSYTEHSFRMVVHLERILAILTLPLLVLPRTGWSLLVRIIAHCVIATFRYRALRAHPSCGVTPAIVVAMFGWLVTGVMLQESNFDANQGKMKNPSALSSPAPVGEEAVQKILDHTTEKVDELIERKISPTEDSN